MQVWNPLYLYLTATWTNPNLTIASISKRLLGSFHTLSSYRNHPKPTLHRLRTVAGFTKIICSSCPTCSEIFQNCWCSKCTLKMNCSDCSSFSADSAPKETFWNFKLAALLSFWVDLRLDGLRKWTFLVTRHFEDRFFVLLHHVLLWWLLFDPLTCLFSSKLVAFRFSELMMFNSCDFVWNIMVSQAWLWCVPFRW